MAGVSAPSAIQASLQGVIDALNQGDCKGAQKLLSAISEIDSMQRGFMGGMLVNPSMAISDKIQKIVEMAVKKWKIQLKAPELAGTSRRQGPCCCTGSTSSGGESSASQRGSHSRSSKSS